MRAPGTHLSSSLISARCLQPGLSDDAYMSAGADAAAAAYDSVADGEAESRRHMQARCARLFMPEAAEAPRGQAAASCPAFLSCRGS